MAAILYNTYWLRYIYIVEKIVRRGIVATIEVQIKDRENESFVNMTVKQSCNTFFTCWAFVHMGWNFQ